MVFEKIAQPDSADDVARVVYSRGHAAEAARVNNSRHTCCCIYFSKTIIRYVTNKFVTTKAVSKESRQSGQLAPLAPPFSLFLGVETRHVELLKKDVES